MTKEQKIFLNEDFFSLSERDIPGELYFDDYVVKNKHAWNSNNPLLYYWWNTTSY